MPREGHQGRKILQVKKRGGLTDRQSQKQNARHDQWRAFT
jgi:hypothetical protein